MEKTRAFLNLYTISVQRRAVSIDAPNYIDAVKCNVDKKTGNLRIEDLKKFYSIDLSVIFLDFLKNYLKENKNLDDLTNAKESKKSYIKFRTESVDEDKKKGRIWGEIRAGSSGYPSDISKFKADPKTLIEEEVLQYNVSDKEHDMCNYFFEAFIPKDGYRGTIVFLSLGARGVVTPIKVALEKYIKDKDYGFKIEMSPLMSKVKGSEKSKVKKIKMISRPLLPIDKQEEKKSRRKDKVSNIKLTSVVTGFEEDSIDVIKFLKLSESKKLSKVKTYFDGFYELDESEFKSSYEVEILTGDRRRTIIIQEDMKNSTSIEVTDELKKDKNGFYTVDSLRVEVDKIINDIEKGFL